MPALPQLRLIARQLREMPTDEAQAQRLAAEFRGLVRTPHRRLA